MPHFGPLPWYEGCVQRLHKSLSTAYPDPTEVKALAQKVRRFPDGKVNWRLSIDTVWREVMIQAYAAGLLGALVRTALEDDSVLAHHDRIRAALNELEAAEEGIGVEPAAPEGADADHGTSLATVLSMPTPHSDPEPHPTWQERLSTEISATLDTLRLPHTPALRLALSALEPTLEELCDADSTVPPLGPAVVAARAARPCVEELLDTLRTVDAATTDKRERSVRTARAAALLDQVRRALQELLGELRQSPRIVP
jgi:hypothetical protein